MGKPSKNAGSREKAIIVEHKGPVSMLIRQEVICSYGCGKPWHVPLRKCITDKEKASEG